MSLALAYIQSIICENKAEIEPCHECSSCKQFESFNYPDIHFCFPFVKVELDSIEPVENCTHLRRLFVSELSKSLFITKQRWLNKMDAKNKQAIIPVSEAQNLADILSLTGYSSNARVVLLWMPELLHHATANKLLKMIEEPQKNVFWVLVSCDLNNVLPTIKSRCVIIKTEQNTSSEIKTYLNLLQPRSQTISLVPGAHTIGINEDSIWDNERYIDASEKFVGWMRLLYSAKPKEIIEWSEDLAAYSREDVKGFLNFTTHVLRDAFVFKNNPAKTDLFNYNSFDIRKFAPFVNTEKMIEILDLLETARKDFERNCNPRLVLLDTSLQLTKYIGKA